MKSAVFLPIVVLAKLATENFRESVSENPAKFDFFSATFQRPCSVMG